MAFDPKFVTSYPTKHVSLTPSDTVSFGAPTAILVLNAGNVAVADEDGTVVTYPAIDAGPAG